MKKKIILSLLIVFLLFLAGLAIGLHIVNKTTANLDSLLALHKVEIIRQDLVINVQTVQTNLYTTGTLFGKELDAIVDNVLRLQESVYSCTDCHHEPDVKSELLGLQDLTEKYKEALSYFITSTADKKRIGRLQAVAADIGDMIIANSQNMALEANETLRRKTLDAQEKVQQSIQVLMITLTLSLVIVLVIALYLINSITKPVAELLTATRKIRQGELGYTSGYAAKDEFRELLDSFNDMSRNLSENNEKLLSQMQRNQTILQTSTDGFLLVAEDGRVIEANPSMCSMTEYSSEEITTMRFIDLVDNRVIGDGEGILDSVKKAGALVTPVDLKTKSSSIIAVEISVTFAELENRERYFCFVRDISDRIKMEEELHKGQKLESLGVLAGGIAHDFNNLLTGILGYIDLAVKTSTPGDKIHTWLENAKKASVRAQNLTQQLLTFSRGGEPVKNLLTVKELVEESTGFVLSGSNVKCEYEYQDDLWPINADKGQLGQVIQNIVLNGAQSMQSGGAITVRAVNAVVPKGNAHSLSPGNYVKIEFTDQGSGISKNDLEKIFDPYFTTKDDGNGLGLTICHSIVSKHGGTITVESTLGAGSTFSVYLPASISEKKLHKAESMGMELPGTGRVLIMDDEEQVREIVGEMLSHLGYQPSYALDGTGAVKLYKDAMRNGRAFDAVILDLTIPGGMGGKEAIAKLLQIDPDVKAIVSSGYSNDPVMAEYKVYGFKGVVTKPFDIEQLSKILHAIIQT